jgi:hypothetical protein
MYNKIFIIIVSGKGKNKLQILNGIQCNDKILDTHVHNIRYKQLVFQSRHQTRSHCHFVQTVKGERTKDYADRLCSKT